MTRTLGFIGFSVGLLLFCGGLALPPTAHAVDGNIVESQLEITPAGVSNGDMVGRGLTLIPDLGGVGLPALAVGRPGDDESANDAGAVDLLFLASDGSVISTLVIDDTPAGDPNDAFDLLFGDGFGHAIASLGDVNGGAQKRIAVGAPLAASGALFQTGAVWILDLDVATGVPVAGVKIANLEGGFGALAQSDRFGTGVASLGDWDGDGVTDLAVGASRDDDGGTDSGAIYVLYLNVNGTVRDQQKISETAGGFAGGLASGDRFGSSLAMLADQDADGRMDLAVGAPMSSNGGAVWLLFMAPGCFAATPVCSVGNHFEIREGTVGLNAQLSINAEFGDSVAWMPASSSLDVDRLLVGSPAESSAGSGAVWMLDLSGGAINATRKIANGVGWTADLTGSAFLGSGVASLGDLNADGITDFGLAARGTIFEPGAIFSALTSPCPSLVLRPVVYHNPNDEAQNTCGAVTLPDDPMITLNLYIESGGLTSAVSACDVATGGGTEMCAWDVRLVFENAFSVASFTPTTADVAMSNFVLNPGELRLNWIQPAAPLNGAVRIGTIVVANNGSGDGVIRIAPGSAAVGASLQLQTIGERVIAVPEPGLLGLVFGIGWLVVIARSRRTALSRFEGGAGGFERVVRVVGLVVALVVALSWTNASEAATSIKGQVRFSEGESFVPNSGAENFGDSLAAPGDIDADGTPDLIIGCCRVIGLQGPERFLVEFLSDTGGPVAPPVVDPGEGANLHPVSMTAIPDRDGDGRSDLLVGTPTTGPSVTDQVSMLFFNGDGTRKPARIQYGDGLGGFPAGLLTSFPSDRFGESVAWLGDVDQDVVTHEFAVGAPGDGTEFPGAGAIWIVSLDATNTVTKQQKFTSGDFGFSGGSQFGTVVSALGDLDGNGSNDLAISAPGCPVIPDGCLLIVLLEPDGSNGVQAKSTTVLGEGLGGFPTPLESPLQNIGSLVWMGDIAQGEGGVLAVGIPLGVDSDVLLVHLLSDGTVRDFYRIGAGANVGESIGVGIDDSSLGTALAAPGDLDGDEVPDLVVGAADAQAARLGTGSVGEGAVFIFFMIDSDFDGLDDNLDNCPGGVGQDPALSFNPGQADADGDGIGDLCDICPSVVDPFQDDADGDGEGDLCEPVILSLQPTGTPTSPSWDVLVECGAFVVQQSNVAVIPPEAGPNPAFSLSCPVAPPGGVCATFDPVNSTVLGPGLVSPVGVRDDSFYLHLEGSGVGGRLCQDLGLPSKVGELTTDAILGGSVAAAALSEEGIQTPGFGFALASDAAGAIPITDIRLVTGDPLPRVTLELGPAFVTGGDTRWDVLLKNANDRFHRVSFGLVAPSGTTTADMRFVGCTGVTAEPGEVRTCGAGVGPTMNPFQSWTVGPVAPAQTPAGLRDHTMYIVAEGAIPFGISLPYLNLPGQTIVLGTLEFTGEPDLQPALILEGVDLIADRFGAGTIVPFERSALGPLPGLNEVRLVGQFNPAEDEDGDGIQDLGDNCPFSQNVDQADDGGFLSTEPDAKGNACQCGDASRDGIVQDSTTPSANDLVQIRDFLLGLITNPVIKADVAARCSVVGTPECNIRDLVFLQKAFDAVTPSENRCDASLAPAIGS